MPHSSIEHGYVDLEVDDYAKGDLLHGLQNIAMNMSHRSLPAKDQ